MVGEARGSVSRIVAAKKAGFEQKCKAAMVLADSGGWGKAPDCSWRWTRDSFMPCFVSSQVLRAKV